MIKILFISLLFHTLLTATTLSLNKTTYTPQENILVDFSDMTAQNKDWIAIYKKEDATDWKYVIKWKWTNDIAKGHLSFAPLPVGEYEVRAFYNNNYRTKASQAFTVTAKTETLAKVEEQPQTNYTEWGRYKTVKEKINGSITLYKPTLKGKIKNNSPLIIFATGGWGSSIDPYDEFISFIVSKGYCVMGVSTGSQREEEFQKILDTLNKEGNLIDKSKIALMGNSTGGGSIFYNLKHLKDKGYADQSFLISFDGWFAMGLRKEELETLNTNLLLLQFGGEKGLALGNGRYYQDPRILMALYNTLPNKNKAFSFLNTNNHTYPAGSMEGKNNLLEIVGSMIAYTFENGGEKAKAIALNDKHESIKISDKQGEDPTYKYTCKGTDSLTKGSDYNYCDVNNPIYVK